MPKSSKCWGYLIFIQLLRRAGDDKSNSKMKTYISSSVWSFSMLWGPCQAIFTDKLSLCPPKPSTHPPLHIALFPRGSWGWKSRWEIRMLDSEFCTRIGTGRAGPSSQPLTSLFSSCSQLPAAPWGWWGHAQDTAVSLHIQASSTPSANSHSSTTFESKVVCTKPEPLTLQNLNLGE